MTDADIRLDPMRWWDIAEILPLEQALFSPDTWSAATFWSELAAPSRRYLVARAGTHAPVVGYAGLAMTGRTGDVQTVAVSPSAQGRGIGAILLAALLQEAVAADAAEVLLEVRHDNTAAQRLYLAAGFQVIARRRGYYQPGNVDALIMRKRPVSGS